MTEDADKDIERLYNALRDNKINTARIIHKHLKVKHYLDNKTIRDSVKTHGLKNNDLVQRLDDRTMRKLWRQTKKLRRGARHG